MKRITALLLAVVMAFGSVGIADTAQANNIDIKARGTWEFAFGIMDNSHFGKSFNPTSNRTYDDAIPNRDNNRRRGAHKNFEALQRVRVQANFISGEHLQGVLQFEIGDTNWGENGTGRRLGGSLNGRATNVATRLAYLDWIVPHTQVTVRMGIQRLNLPSGRMGNPVFSDCVAGIVVNTPITDNFGLTAFWLRPWATRDTDYDMDGRKFRNDTDAFGLIAPVTFTGVSFSPYFMYANIGNVAANAASSTGFWDHNTRYVGNSTRGNSSANAWWLGANLNVDILDPLVFNLDAIYGRVANTRHSFLSDTDVNGDAIRSRISASGWMIASTLDYKLDWGTPGIFGWYSSGDRNNSVRGHLDGDDDLVVERARIGRLPVLGPNGGFGPTSFGTEGYFGIGNGNGQNGAVVSTTGTGTWGIGIQLADVSFIQDLSHTLRFAYYQGTNSATNYRVFGTDTILGGGAVRSVLMYDDPMYLTTKDSVFEVNFDHVYKIYENLEVCLELGWLRLNSNRSTWHGNDFDSSRNLKRNDDAFKAGLNFKYSF